MDPIDKERFKVLLSLKMEEFIDEIGEDNIQFCLPVNTEYLMSNAAFAVFEAIEETNSYYQDLNNYYSKTDIPPPTYPDDPFLGTDASAN